MCRHSRKSGDYWVARCAQRLATAIATQLVRLLLDSRFLVEMVYFLILNMLRMKWNIGCLSIVPSNLF